jgi:hypothetical protein
MMSFLRAKIRVGNVEKKSQPTFAAIFVEVEFQEKMAIGIVRVVPK